MVNPIGQVNELCVVTRGKVGLRAVSGNQDLYTWLFSGLVVRKP
ncbi:MAG TPA: hypothetical protein VG433_02665 [Pirellulales bacterium]|nr:hypothetical protein [Pirellulales bacterium]